ncbi:hypothetical protein [Endozoicomonas numazuensis]|uniref:hypothetical protein n=1 Tax=Endozoicomonas numazuensis TaxID=1137799 RepID=UPI000552A56B|nr:hypothetical protein [Endozoicomonas numazuensis]
MSSSSVPPSGSGKASGSPITTSAPSEREKARSGPASEIPRKRRRPDFQDSQVSDREVSALAPSKLKKIKQAQEYDAGSGISSGISSPSSSLSPSRSNEDSLDYDVHSDSNDSGCDAEAQVSSQISSEEELDIQDFTDVIVPPSDALKFFLSELGMSVGRSVDMEMAYQRMVESTLAHTDKVREPLSLSFPSERIEELSEELFEHIRSLKIEEPTHARDNRWPGDVPASERTESDRKYMHEINPLLNLCFQMAYHQEKTPLTQEQQNHLYCQLISFVIQNMQLAKCGDFSHVATDFLLPKLAEEGLPVKLAMMNIDCHVWVNQEEESDSDSHSDYEPDFVQYKEVERDFNQGLESGKTKEDETYLMGNHIALVLHPLASNSEENLLVAPEAVIIDPMFQLRFKASETSNHYIRTVEANLGYPKSDFLDFNYTYFD